MASSVKKFRSDILALLYTGMAAFLALAFWTYNPRDPSFSSWNWNRTISNACGVLGSFIADLNYQLFGICAAALPLILLFAALSALRRVKVTLSPVRVFWACALILSGTGLLTHYFSEARFFNGEIRIGGLLGLGVHHALLKIAKPAGTQIILWSSTLALLIFSIDRTIHELTRLPKRGLEIGLKFILATWKRPQWRLPRVVDQKQKPAALQAATVPAEFLERQHEAREPEYEPLVEFPSRQSGRIPVETWKRERGPVASPTPPQVENWELPKLFLLEDPPPSRIRIDDREVRRKGELLKEKLALFSVRGEVVAARPGPMVTMYEFKPAADVKLSKITELADDLSLALASESLRIQAPIPGRDVVGIETANQQRETVYLKEMLCEAEFWQEEIRLPITLGKQVNGQPRIVDLRKMPHLMVAGTTGSGKSVFTVSTIVGLLFRHSPKTLRLILIDPKQVDLAAFEKVPHLLMPVVTDTRRAVMSLKWAVREMEKRYKSMSKFGARGLEDYNQSVQQLTKEQIEDHRVANEGLEGKRKEEAYYYQPLPYLVVVVEEFADLMVTDKNQVETSVVRLAQKARACGIHLIICMQSPRKEVVTGLIRTNFSSRIAFKVSDGMESRIVLDGTGAERLLSQGDMLFKGLGSSSLTRYHGPFLKDSEIKTVTKFWSAQGEPAFDPAIMSSVESEEGSGENSSSENRDHDEKYNEILAWVATQKEVSASLIQRRYQLGYPRAARLIENLEAEGVVSSASGSKPRQVLLGNSP